MSGSFALTARQSDCLAAIRSHVKLKGEAPSLRELARSLGIKSLGRVNELVSALEERGHLRKMQRRARSITLVDAEPGIAGACRMLPPAVEEKLRQHCASTGEDPAAVIADAVALLLDDLERVPLP